MPNIVETGYSQDAYSTDPYASAQVAWGIRSQVSLQINSTHHVKSQTKLNINAVHRVHEQISRMILTLHSVHEQVSRQINNSHHAVHEQTNRQIASLHAIRSQIQRQITVIHTVHQQISRLLTKVHAVNEQINREIDNASHRVKEQTNRQIANTHNVKEQVAQKITHGHSVHEQILRHPGAAFHHLSEEIRAGSVLFLTTGYTETPYGESDYTVPGFTAHLRSQVARHLNKVHAVHEQIQRQINSSHRVHEQIQRRLDKVHNLRSQINRLRSHILHTQVTIVLYNITNLRVLLDFPSRGTSGTNWTANSTGTGDFSVNNLNTDIVEQVWRSASTVVAGITLTCDTQISQGVFVDTLAFLNHNLTTSANIVWEQSNDSGFSVIGQSTTLTPEKTNFYYISPMLPTNGYRYHRFSIDDPTNTNSYLQIGTIVFGTSVILQGDNFVDQVTKQLIHFSDKILTEGFTNVSNDRALKNQIGLEFKNLDFNSGNYSKLENIFTTARTSLKCLWIPTPQYASRFAIFGKLTAMPSETHNDLGVNANYVSFSLTIDESL